MKFRPVRMDEKPATKMAIAAAAKPQDVRRVLAPVRVVNHK